MPKLSIIIVNYNVKYFLLHCIDSIFKSNIDLNLIEVIVIDNASKESCELPLKELFPKVKYHYNNKNIDFGKANNLGFEMAKGDYILALNPDTILTEDTLAYCIDYLDKNELFGAIGVKMIDGSGGYLKESKRGLPTLWNSLCKFSGLTKFFPNSKIFSGYYEGDKSENANQEVDVLCGAFMMMRSKIVHRLQGFDPAFFMYGEDIDLSLRIKQEGYKIGYIAETSIIHFKGESSKRSSFNYIKNFYQAMLIFVQKNYKGLNGVAMKMLINTAIFLLGIFNYIKNNLINYFWVLLDSLILFQAFVWMKRGWGIMIFDNPEYFNNAAAKYNSYGAVFIWMLSLWFFGHYDKNWKWYRTFIGIVFGTMAILIIYSILPDYLRSSRAMIFIGALPLLAMVQVTKKIRDYIANYKERKYSSIYYYLGTKPVEIHSLLESNVVRKISSIKSISEKELSEIVSTTKDGYTTNVIIESGSLRYNNLFQMMGLHQGKIKTFFTNEAHQYLISSESSKYEGSTIDKFSNYKLNHSFYKRLKRMFDFIYGLIQLFSNNHKMPTSEIWKVVMGSKTWVGGHEETISNGLDQKPFIYSTASLIDDTDLFPKLTSKDMADHYYAKNYSIMIDYDICTKNKKK